MIIITIGLLHTRLNPDKVSRAYIYSALARLEGADLYYFTSRDVNFNSNTINAKTYQAGTWIEKERPFPDVIMNVSGPNTPKQRKIYNRLEKKVPFTSIKVGNKLAVYNRLQSAGDFSRHIIPYQPARRLSDVTAFLQQYRKIILKPNSDSHGNQVYYIEKAKDNYFFIYRNCKRRFKEKKAKAFLASLIGHRQMILQKYINSRRRSGEPYDFRLHVQKDGAGIWQITTVFPRVAPRNRIITNLSQGAALSLFERFLEIEFPNHYRQLKFKIEAFALLLARHMDNIYGCEFDELGIDIGLDENRHIWLYEVNWRPGHVFIEVKAARNAVAYAIYLGKKKREEQ